MNILSFFSVKAVAEKLAKHELTDGAKLGLAIVFVYIICAMAISFDHYNMQHTGPWAPQAHQVEGGVMYVPTVSEAGMLVIKTLFFYLLVIVGLLVPTMVLFHHDHLANGKHFVERYMCLAVPLLVQSNLLLMCGDVLSQIVSFLADYVLHITWSGNALGGGILLVILGSFYWRLNKWLKYTAQPAHKGE